MRVRDMRVLANGLRTDHPVPGLPFVDDSHIPIEDPKAVESVGRKSESGMWGRTDPMRVREGEERAEAGWKAFTTDPLRRELAWVVRWHPTRGRSVWLVSDEEASSIYSLLENDMVLWRAGGYWLGHDGGWHRPVLIFDWASECYVSRAVPGSTTITAAERLEGRTLASHTPGHVAGLASVHDLDLDDTSLIGAGEWANQLEMWAASRPEDGLPLTECIVDLAAPELNAAQMLTAAEVAALAGISAPTLRGYISRGENEGPAPHGTLGARAVWTRPVIYQWVEARNYTAEAAETAVHIPARFGSSDFDGIELPPGLIDVWEKVHYWLLADLTSSPGLRPGLLRRWRDRRSAAYVAKLLSLRVARGLDQLVPMHKLADTISDAILGEIAHQAATDTTRDIKHYTLLPWTATMLDWLIRYSPAAARYCIYRTIGYVEDHPDRYGVTTRQSLLGMVRTGIALDGAGGSGSGRSQSGAALTDDQVDAFLATVVPDDSPIS